jgi:signal transduction histidine kinase
MGTVSLSLALRRTPTATAVPPPRVRLADVAVAAAVLAVQAALATLLPEGAFSHRPDAAGWALLTASAAALVWRRRSPTGCLAGNFAAVAPYHYLQNLQQAVILSSMVALYAFAVAGPPLRTLVVLPLVIAAMIGIMSSIGGHADTTMLQSAGWVVAVAVVGEVVRMHRRYVAAITERAERAERTREEEAARRVAEERLRIARDLHDLIAHGITLIGVQTSVAAHILLADPDRLDREAVAGALDAIADTCREARAELRTTLRVLRADGDGPLPGLSGIPALARAAEAAGARVEFAADTGPEPVPSAVGAAAYRIVQESLTNAVRHAGAVGGPRITVRLECGESALRVVVEDDGPEGDPAVRGRGAPAGAVSGSRTAAAGAAPFAAPAPAVPAPRGEGFGIIGMRERARSVGGTLTAGPRLGAPGFTVTAELPFTAFAADPQDAAPGGDRRPRAAEPQDAPRGERR